ncbi:MAG TPA: hypothetical protein PLD46_05630 [Hyphomicrobium sp.]|nr:hypothetical protein [Hyphomicrobium sp.]
MSRRLIVDTVFANLLAIFMLALMLGGCSMQQNAAERPDWSLNGPDRGAQPQSSDGQNGEWIGPAAR